ncbi:MAG TPA: hypothetical protein PKD20_02320 [Candidatus Saccharibacteria bacterium]|nr:hypothetical protein [Candidatus Saccharibacteria bacterium]
MGKKKSTHARALRYVRKNWLSFLFIFVGLLSAATILLVPKAQQKVEDEKPAELVNCDGDKNLDFDCWTEHFTALVQQQSVKAAMDDIKSRYESNGYLRGECHQVTHVIGRAAVKSGMSLGSAYQQGDSYCASGYYHGAVEEIAKSMGKDTFIAQVDSVCQDIIKQSKYSINHHNCTHGIGHGLMLITEDELFESINACDSIVDSWSKSSCLGGVFMENVIADPSTNPTHATKYLKPEDPMYPCNSVEQTFKEPCYLIQTAYALRQTGQDFAKVFDMCGAVEEDMRDTCWQSLGRDASGNSVSNISITRERCELGKTIEAQMNCAIGAAKDFVYHYADDAEAYKLCATFSEQEVENTCNATTASYIKSFR